MKPTDFILAIQPAARSCMLRTGIPMGFTIAQAALESEWAKSGLTIQTNNLFGIKADSSWHGESISMPTVEHIGGKEVTVPAKWRKYPNWQASIDDHVEFLLHDRYKPAFAHKDDIAQFAKAIQVAGYSTDEHYAEKIMSIIKSHNLQS